MIDLASLAENEWFASPAVLNTFRESGISVESEAPMTWTSDGRSLYFIGRSLGVASVWRLDVNPDLRSVTGGPFRTTAMGDDNTGDWPGADDRRDGVRGIDAHSSGPFISAERVGQEHHRTTGSAHVERHRIQ